jgi:hypothetical protein
MAMRRILAATLMGALLPVPVSARADNDVPAGDDVAETVRERLVRSIR